MKNLFKGATFWELTNVLWWAFIILIGVPALVWHKLVKKLYYHIKNTYFLKFRISKKSDEWCRDVVKNFEILWKTEEDVGRVKRYAPINYKCYMYCKNRLNEKN